MIEGDGGVEEDERGKLCSYAHKYGQFIHIKEIVLIF
jgi:hypothetical protein